MRINGFRLNKAIEKYSRVVIYGCGKRATEIYIMLQKYKKKTEFCIANEENTADVFARKAIPVYKMEECNDSINNDMVLIISVEEGSEKAAEKILQEQGIKNYLFISQFDRSSVWHLKNYRNKNIQEGIEEIAEWYIDGADDSSSLEIAEERRRIEGAISRGKNENVIIFSIGVFTPRSLKIAEALKGRGYKVKVFINPGGYVLKICESGLEKLNLECVKCSTIEELMYRMIMERGEVIHLFTNRTKSAVDRVLIQMRELFSPIVYDEYDIVNGFYVSIPQDIMENERFCLENASAICNRGYELDYLAEDSNYSICAKTIQFPDYCNNEQCDSEINENDLSICYVGQIFVGQNDSSDRWLLELADMCKKNQCHFHVYPNKLDEVEHSAYIEHDKTNFYFHFHKPVPCDEMKFEISKYDYGVHPVTKEAMQDGCAFYKKEKMTYATTNKFFDYLDAGLPIVAAGPIKLAEYFEEKGVLLKKTIEEYDFEELRNRKKELKANVSTVRKAMQIENHIDELLEFYKALV